VVGCIQQNEDLPLLAGEYNPDIEHCILDNFSPAAAAGAFAAHDLQDPGSFQDLIDFMTGDSIYCSDTTSPGFDGWQRDFTVPKERNLGQATLHAGLVSYSTYIPSTNICSAEGRGSLYGLYYQTGTSWLEDIFGNTTLPTSTPIPTGVDLGAGLSTTPNIHVGEEEGSKAFIQTSVGQIVEIPEPNLPFKNIKSGRIKWRDIE
jgi:Tfp pilus tip-associated adhesin PilY1